MSTLALNCWVFGESSQRIFPVRVANTETVGFLKEVIKNEKVAFRNIDADSLGLWRVSLLVDQIFKQGLKTLDEDPELLPMTKLSKVFPDEPEAGASTSLYYRRLMSQSLHLRLRNTSSLVKVMENLKTTVFRPLSASHALHKLWSLSWNCDDNHLFEERKVERDEHPASYGGPVPKTCVVLKVEDGIKELLQSPGVSGFLIREEFKEASRALVEFATTEKYQFQTTNVDIEDEEVDAMQVDDDPRAPLDNPFLNPAAPKVSRMGGFILSGHPGIGKTAWLQVVLIQRLQAGLPTIYQAQEHKLFFFNEVGVFVCDPRGADRAEFMADVPESTWCLVGANMGIKVLAFLIFLDLFIVQTSSSRNERVKWVGKISNVVLPFYMKPWTLSELLVGRMLQHKPCSEVDLEVFYNRFGPSARSAYSHASLPAVYEESLLEAIGAINFEILDNVLRQATSLNLSFDISHKLLLISPGAIRYSFIATIPTRYLYDKLEDAVVNHSLEAAARLYSMFLRNPRTRASGGYMLDDAIHVLFSKGGEWPIVPMTRNRPGPKFTHWKTRTTNINLEYLRLGRKRRAATIASVQLPKGVKYKPLRSTSFLQGANLTLADGYYWPSSKTEETLDAFIYDATSKTATILQAAVSSRHLVKEEGVQPPFQ